MFALSTNKKIGKAERKELNDEASKTFRILHPFKKDDRVCCDMKENAIRGKNEK